MNVDDSNSRVIGVNNKENKENKKRVSAWGMIRNRSKMRQQNKNEAAKKAKETYKKDQHLKIKEIQKEYNTRLPTLKKEIEKKIMTKEVHSKARENMVNDMNEKYPKLNIKDLGNSIVVNVNIDEIQNQYDKNLNDNVNKIFTPTHDGWDRNTEFKGKVLSYNPEKERYEESKAGGKRRKTRKRRKNLVDKLFRLAGGKRRKKTRKKRGGECRTGESNWDCQKRLRKEKQQQFAYDRVMKSEYNKKKDSELQSEINVAESVPIEKISIPKMRKSNYLKGQKKRHFPAQYLHQLDLGKYKGGRRRKKRGGNTLPCPFCGKGNFKNISDLKVHLEDPKNKKCKEKYLNFDLRLGERGGKAALILAEMKNDTNMTINNNMSDEDYKNIKIIIDELSKDLQKGGRFTKKKRRKRRKKTRRKKKRRKKK